MRGVLPVGFGPVGGIVDDDDFALLALAGLPVLSANRGAAWTEEFVNGLRERSHLSDRTELFARLVEAEAAVTRPQEAARAIEQAEPLVDAFERRDLTPSAARAALVVAQGYAQRGIARRARTALRHARELAEACGDATVARRMRAIGTLLAPAASA